MSEGFDTTKNIISAIFRVSSTLRRISRKYPTPVELRLQIPDYCLELYANISRLIRFIFLGCNIDLIIQKIDHVQLMPSPNPEIKLKITSAHKWQTHTISHTKVPCISHYDVTPISMSRRSNCYVTTISTSWNFTHSTWVTHMVVACQSDWRQRSLGDSFPPD